MLIAVLKYVLAVNNVISGIVIYKIRANLKKAARYMWISGIVTATTLITGTV